MKKNNSCGFTFIELMLAAAIFAIAALSIYATFNSGITAWKKAQEAQALYQGLRLSLERISADLENAVIFRDEADFANFTGGANSLSFYSLVNVYQVLPAHSELRKITYHLQDFTLQRVEQGYSEAPEESPIEKLDDLAGGINSLKFSYLYQEDVSGVISYEWRDNWEETKDVPRGVIIDLELGEEKIALRKFVFIPTGKEGKIE